MGSIVSRIRLCLNTLKELAASYEEISKCLDQSPGIPFPNPATPFWAVPTSNLAQEGCSKPLPDWADIGSHIVSIQNNYESTNEHLPAVVTILDALSRKSENDGRSLIDTKGIEPTVGTQIGLLAFPRSRRRERTLNEARYVLFRRLRPRSSWVLCSGLT